MKSCLIRRFERIVTSLVVIENKKLNFIRNTKSISS